MILSVAREPLLRSSPPPLRASRSQPPPLIASHPAAGEGRRDPDLDLAHDGREVQSHQDHLGRDGASGRAFSSGRRSGSSPAGNRRLSEARQAALSARESGRERAGETRQDLTRARRCHHRAARAAGRAAAAGAAAEARRLLGLKRVQFGLRDRAVLVGIRPVEQAVSRSSVTSDFVSLPSPSLSNAIIRATRPSAVAGFWARANDSCTALGLTGRTTEPGPMRRPQDTATSSSRWPNRRRAGREARRTETFAVTPGSGATVSRPPRP